jgi:SAM-dependent methyltransferase
MRAALLDEEKRPGERPGGTGLALRAEMAAHKGNPVASKKGYTVIECTSCGFAHLDPLPTEKDLERIYRDEYFSTEKPDFTERVSEDEEWWTTVFDERLAFMESALGERAGRVLDIGCGPGFFLRRAMSRGWECLGVEPSSMAAEVAAAQGVRVRKVFFDGAAMKREGLSFDAVHLSEVLEHVRDPLGVLGGAFSLLEPGGIACVVVPNDFSPVQEVLRSRLGYDDYWVAAPHHINYFSFETLGALMKRAGFSLIRTTATFPMDFFLLMGERYVGDDNLGRRCHHMRTRLDIMLEDRRLRAFKKEMYDLMARHGIGREAVVFGRKPMKEEL